MSAHDGSERPSDKHQRGIFESPKGSGVWGACYFDEHGRRHREKVGPKKLALEVYRKRKTEIRERRFFPDGIRRRETLLSEAIDDYLARKKERLLSYVNWERCGRYWKEAFPGKTLRELESAPGQIERYAARRRAEGMADNSVNIELGFLRTAYNMAIEDGKAKTNPVLSKFFAKVNNQRVRYLTDEEETLLRGQMDPADWPKVALALHTGLRQGNLFRLGWTDVNFDAGIITARRSKSGEDYHVPMNDEVRAILQALPSRLRSPWVFPSESGKTPLDPKNFVHRVFMPALKRAKIQNFHWHDARHTFASRLVMKGVDLRTVQELMGHKTTAMTLRYSHLSPAHKLEAVQRLTSPTATRTATGSELEKVATQAGGKVVELPGDSSEPSRDRTVDPLVKSQMLYRLS